MRMSHFKILKVKLLNSNLNLSNGNYNISLGSDTLYNNIDGNVNISIGASALFYNLASLFHFDRQQCLSFVVNLHSC